MPETNTLTALRQLLGDRLSTADDILQRHGCDESSHSPHPPDALCFPNSTDEVVGVVNICRQRRAALIPFGAGSSVEGNAPNTVVQLPREPQKWAASCHWIDLIKCVANRRTNIRRPPTLRRR